MSNYPSHMDHECIELCDAINLFPGIRTIGSCCGHGVRFFSVELTLTDEGAAAQHPLMRNFKYEREAWQGTELYSADSLAPGWSLHISKPKWSEKTFLTLWGPRGQKGYDSSHKLAALIRADFTKPESK